MREALLAVGRRYAAASFDSTCLITRVTSSTLDESTGRYVDVTTPVYEGPCQLALPTPRVFARDAQDQLMSEQQPILKLPIVGSEQVTVGDLVTMTSNPMDPGLVGTKLQVAGVHPATFATVRRLPVYAITGVPNG